MIKVTPHAWRPFRLSRARCRSCYRPPEEHPTRSWAPARIISDRRWWWL